MKHVFRPRSPAFAGSLHLGLGLLATVACSDATQNAPTQLNLDRPVDIAFACFGGLRITGGNPPDASQELISETAQPVESCRIRSGTRDAANQTPMPAGQEDIVGILPVPDAKWFAFILQSGPGTVAIAEFDTKPSASFIGGTNSDVKMIDADPLTPGKNGISVGEDPIAISTDSSGCYEVIANAGSCDMSVLDINSVFGGVTPGQDAVVNRLVVTNGSGQVIRARAAAMAFEPPSATIGSLCPPVPQGLAYVAYPACHLVAGIDVASGQIVTGIQFDAFGVSSFVDPATVTCPSECETRDPIAPGTRPVALDLERDPLTGRVVLAIGADNSNVLTMYELDPVLYRPLSSTKVPLQNTNGRLGVTAVAVSPVIGMGGTSGIINDDSGPGGEHQFVYAVATDASVRVVDIQAFVARECDTQVDPRFLRSVTDVGALSCLAVGATTTPPRRPGARGPGIELVGDGVPTGVDIFRVEPIEGDSRISGDPRRLIGYFGVVSASDGRSYVLNVDNDDFADFVNPVNPIATPIPLDIAHQIRDGLPNRGALAEETVNMVTRFVCDNPGPDPDAQGGNSAGPRVVGSPARNLPAGVIAAEKVGGLPSIRQVLCDTDGEMDDRPVSELSFSAPLAVRDAVFPDLRGLRSDETWTLTYEGSLSQDKADNAIDGPAVREGQLAVDHDRSMRLVDLTKPFCDAGVEPYDIVQLRGCDPTTGDAGCPIGYTCYVHPQSQVTGIGACMLTEEAERLSLACTEFLTTLRRYTVGKTTTGELQLVPRKHVLRTTPLDGCVDDAQCESLADYALEVASSALPSAETPVDPKTWSCEPDPDRRPQPGTGNRCVLTCEANTDCAFGTICKGNYCMEGVIPPQSCVNALQRFELRAGEAFAVLGSRSGYLHPIIADAGGNCIKAPAANPFQVGRIPLVAPACDPTANPLTGQRADLTYEPNPCQLTVDETEFQLNYVPGMCTLAVPDELLVTRPATALRLRTRGLQLTVVDPTYPGDAVCHGDRGGTLVNVPIVSGGFQIAFRQTAGFAPLALPPQPSFPIKVTRGPLESIWIIDEGDFLSTSIAQPSTRGKVFRIESRAIGVVNLLE